MINTTRIKKHASKLGMMAVLTSTMAISSCVYDKDFAYINDQIVALNRRVSKIEEGMDTRLGRDLSTIRSNQGEVRVEIEQIRGEIQKLSGRVEDSERMLRRTVERDLGDQDTVKKGYGDLNQKVTDLERTVKAQQEYLGLESSVPKDKGGEGKALPEQGQAGQTQPAVTEAPPKSSETDLYDGALASFKTGKYEDATLAFKDFLKKYPKSTRADNAQFWVGECYMALKQYEQAILAYQEVIKKYPKGNKVSNAMLRQAVAFLEINDKTSSRLLLRKIIKDYPNSSEAKIAARKLETIK